MVDWQTVSGMIQPGHRVASGSAPGSPYPRGTIEMQLPFFKKLGLDLTDFYQATLNVSISPDAFELVKPELTFRQVEWTDRHPPEDFSFSRCRIVFNGSRYESWIYYPHPETKQRHFQDTSSIEIIAPLIDGIEYGSKVLVEYNPAEISVSQ